MSDVHAQQGRRLLEATGRPVTFVPRDAPHTMHDPEPQR